METSISPKRFMLIFLAGVVGCLALIFCFNVLVDPYFEYETDLLHLSWLETESPRGRTVKLGLMHQLPEPPQVLILGNSRSLTLPPQTITDLTGLRAFNAAARAGTTYDLLALTRYVLDQPDQDLRAIIVGLDTFILSPKGADDELFRFPFIGYLPELGQDGLVAQWERFVRTISFNATRSSFRLLYRNFLDPHVNEYDYRADGLYVPPDDRQDRRSSYAGPNPVYIQNVLNVYIDDFAQRDPLETSADFEAWLHLATDAGVCVSIFVPPMHSELIHDLRQAQPRYEYHITTLLNYLTQLQGQYPFALYDFTSADRFGGDDFWFTDGVHFLSPNAELIVRRIVENGLCGEGRNPVALQ